MGNRAPAEAPEAAITMDDLEAWEIAADLIADLGAVDATAWASDYMNDLEEDDRLRAVARWRLVTDALAELTQARLH
jgi:hypothetical protein